MMMGTNTFPSPLAYCVSAAGTMMTARTSAANDATVGMSKPIAPKTSTMPTMMRIPAGNAFMDAAWSGRASNPTSLGTPVRRNTPARMMLRPHTAKDSAARALGMSHPHFG